MEIDTYTGSSLVAAKVAFYKKLLHQIPDFVFVLKISPDGVMSFPFISQSAYTYFEHNDEEAQYDALSVFKNRVVAEDFQDFLSSIEKSRTTLETWSAQFVALLNGQRRYMKGQATVEREDNDDVFFYGRITDITESKLQEIRLRLSEERYQFALEASTKGIWDLDLATNKVFYSAQSMKMLQFGDFDNIDSHDKWDDRIHHDDRADYELAIKKHLEDQTPFYENCKRMIAMDGSVKWILSRGKVIERRPDGTPLRLIGTHTDITIQKEREEQLRKTMDIISEQNGRLHNFAHIVSHNLRSHAGNFKMLLQIMESDGDAICQNDSYTHLKSTSAALTETIEHLNELVDIQTGLVHKAENLNLQAYLLQVLVVLREEISSNGVRIINRIPVDATIDFNPAYLESILLNFTTNAIKYSCPDRTPEIAYTFTHIDGVKVLEIQDNGVGINIEKYGERLFGMYKTFHKNPESRGIGLFITKNQIEAMGGSVEIASEEGIGTVFKIFFNEKK